MAYLPLLTEKQTFWTSAGAIASGYKLFIYAAGTTTKSTTYQETTGTANTNPVVLNSRGEVPYGVYVAAGSTYKLVLAPSTDSDPPVAPVWTRDNLSATNDTTVTVDQWQASGFTPTYVSGTSFTVTGDRTSTFQGGRRVKTTNTGGTIYSTISTSAYSSVTTVTLVNDSGVLDSGLSSVSVGLLTPQNPSYPALTDTYPVVVGASDSSKTSRIEVDGITTATTRVNYQADENSTLGAAWETKNLSLTASVAANALTVAVKTLGGSDASANNPIIFKFRNVTAGTGTYTNVSLTGALSLTVSSGSTLGTVSATAHRLYLVVFNDASTLRLGIYNPYSATGPTLQGLNDAVAYSSTAEGGAGAADSAQVIYTGTAVSSKSMRIIGYIESTQSTAGTWASTPSKIQILQYGDKKTGDVVQTRFQAVTTSATGTTVLPADNTIPQNTEGDQYMTDSITPTSAINLLRIRSLMLLGFNSGTMTAALFQDSTANALRATTVLIASNSAATLPLNHTMLAGTTSSTAFKWRAGSSGAGTTTFNGAAGTQLYNGVAGSETEITEIFV